MADPSLSIVISRGISTSSNSRTSGSRFGAVSGLTGPFSNMEQAAIISNAIPRAEHETIILRIDIRWGPPFGHLFANRLFENMLRHNPFLEGRVSRHSGIQEVGDQEACDEAQRRSRMSCNVVSP